MTDTHTQIAYYGLMGVGVGAALLMLIFGWPLLFRLFGIVMVPEDSTAILNKKFVLFGANKNLPDGAVVALSGEAGLQADMLPPGLHFLVASMLKDQLAATKGK